MLWMMTAALAAPADYEKNKSDNGCTAYVGPEAASGIGPVQVECHWPEQTVEEIDQLLGDVGIHDDIFGLIIESTVTSEEDGVSSVKQVHNSPPLDHRELVQLMGRKEKDGVITHWWKKAPSQPAVGDGNVLPDTNDGQWILQEHPKGGVSLIYQLNYAPGGSVPSFVIRAFQSSGVLDFLGDLHAYATANG
ncbi:MAG: hypothetical protein GY913_27145 [Proteobacteria bacterium]|nr:hypothetical protein [Pseudomonadota bacterium]MCP4920592.1 hypothetical protein [Pseudomonadota bacterium]